MEALDLPQEPFVGEWEGTIGEEGGKVRILWQDFWRETEIGFTHGQESSRGSGGAENGLSAGKDKAKMVRRRNTSPRKLRDWVAFWGSKTSKAKKL